MSREITIYIDTSDESMIGSSTWEQYNAQRSVQRFLDLVVKEVTAIWPNYSIWIEQSIGGRTLIEGSNVDQTMRDDIRAVITDVWDRQDWFVA